MAEYTPLAVPDCLDTQFLSDLYQNIKCVLDCAQQDRREFRCVPFDVTIEGEINGTRECEIILAADPVTDADSLTAKKEQKMVIFTTVETTQISPLGSQESDNEGTVGDVSYTYYLNCEPQLNTLAANAGAIDSAPPVLGGEGCIQNLCLDCSANDDLELCVRTSASQSGLFSQASYRVRACGAIICVADVSGNEIDGFFKPPRIDLDCCYGRDGLYLAQQNCNALENRFSRSSQRANCTEYNYGDEDTHAIHTSVGITDYLVIGEITVCARNTSTNAQTIQITPAIGCAGEPETCLGQSFSIRGRETNGGDGTGTEPFVDECITFRYVQCGQCQPGQTLFAGIDQINDCTGLTNDGIIGSLEVQSVEQEYCVYTFESQALNFAATPDTFSPCPKFSEIDGMLTKLDSLFEVCENDPALNFSHIERAQDEVVTAPETIVLKLAIPFVPTPDNLFAPLKKWNGLIEICARPARDTSQNRLVGFMQMDLYCGGTLIESEQIDWLIYQIGGSESTQFSDFTPRCLKIDHQCFPCRTDEDITLEITGNVYSNGNSTGPTSGNPLPLDVTLRQSKLFCF